MINTFLDAELIRKWSSAMSGVFTRSDLENLFEISDPVMLHRRIKRLIDNDVVSRFKREFYITADFSIESLSQRVYPDSCLSLGTVLARHHLIGSVPDKTAYAVKSGRNRKFRLARGTLVYCGITPDLLIDSHYENGVRYASPEKAYIDTLYFYQKGFKFSFNVFSDVAVSSLDREKILSLLQAYKNPKFVTFVKGVVLEGNQ